MVAEGVTNIFALLFSRKANRYLAMTWLSCVAVGEVFESCSFVSSFKMDSSRSKESESSSGVNSESSFSDLHVKEFLKLEILFTKAES